MNLAKALKVKNRLSQKIKDMQAEIQVENSKRADAERKISVLEIMNELTSAVNELIRIKIAIFVASTPKRESILRLGELKSKIIFLRGIDTTEGLSNQSYSSIETNYSVVFDNIYVKGEIQKCEEDIDEIQEELDQFNHSTEIEV
jgi:hypothetical protein